MLCRFAHVQSVTFFAHAVVCTVILRRGRGSATFGSGRPRRTRATGVEGAVGTAGQCGGCRRDRRAWPGFEPTRRAAGSQRGRRAGGRARRHPEHRRRSHYRLVRQVTTSDAATTSVPEGGGRAWPPTTHPRHQCGGCRRDRRAWPGFEPTRRAIGSRRGRRAGGRARRHPEHQRRSQQESR